MSSLQLFQWGIAPLGVFGKIEHHLKGGCMRDHLETICLFLFVCVCSTFASFRFWMKIDYIMYILMFRSSNLHAYLKKYSVSVMKTSTGALSLRTQHEQTKSL